LLTKYDDEFLRKQLKEELDVEPDEAVGPMSKFTYVKIDGTRYSLCPNFPPWATWRRCRAFF